MHAQIKEENVTQPKALSIILIIILFFKNKIKYFEKIK
jgi:hypothetical protein